MVSYIPRAKKRLNCASCGGGFLGNGNAMYCSATCRNRAREFRRGADCSSCGRRVFRAPSSAGSPVCQACRRTRPGYRARIAASADQTWLCNACGVKCSRPATRGVRPKWCPTCRKALQNRDIKITEAQRVSIYVRDEWACWICEGLVQRDLIGSRSHWRPSLDHVLPRSKGGSDDMENLKLAHWWCNSALSDGRAYSPEDFRVSA